MSRTDLSEAYRAYIACLNAQAWRDLGRFVDDDVEYNRRRVGLEGYRDMLIMDFQQIPDLRFVIGLLMSDPPLIASRLDFDCTPTGDFLGLPVNGKNVRFSENVFYRFRNGKISEVWSVTDKAAIERQI